MRCDDDDEIRDFELEWTVKQRAAKKREIWNPFNDKDEMRFIHLVSFIFEGEPKSVHSWGWGLRDVNDIFFYCVWVWWQLLALSTLAPKEKLHLVCHRQSILERKPNPLTFQPADDSQYLTAFDKFIKPPTDDFASLHFRPNDFLRCCWSSLSLCPFSSLSFSLSLAHSLWAHLSGKL